MLSWLRLVLVSNTSRSAPCSCLDCGHSFSLLPWTAATPSVFFHELLPFLQSSSLAVFLNMVWHVKSSLLVFVLLLQHLVLFAVFLELLWHLKCAVVVFFRLLQHLNFHLLSFLDCCDNFSLAAWKDTSRADSHDFVTVLLQLTKHHLLS